MNLLLFILQDMPISEMIKGVPMGWTTYLVPFTYWLVIIAAFIAVGMSIYNMSKNPAAAKATLIGFAAIAVLFLLMWALSSGNVPADLQDKVSSKQYKLIGAGLMTAGFLSTLGLIIMIIDLIRGVIKS